MSLLRVVVLVIFLQNVTSIMCYQIRVSSQVLFSENPSKCTMLFRSALSGLGVVQREISRTTPRPTDEAELVLYGRETRETSDEKFPEVR